MSGQGRDADVRYWRCAVPEQVGAPAVRNGWEAGLRHEWSPAADKGADGRIGPRRIGNAPSDRDVAGGAVCVQRAKRKGCDVAVLNGGRHGQGRPGNCP